MISLVSIIIATYNRAHLIGETLESVMAQTYKNFECLLIDDGSTDNTEKVITPIINVDYRFNYLKRPKEYKKGLPGCRNYGLDIAKGDYIIFFDDDDIAHPLNLEICVLELEKNKEAFFCNYLRKTFTSNFHYNFNYSKNYTSFKIDKNDLNNVIQNKLPINSCAVMWHKNCFVNNRFNETLMYAEEWELYSRIISQGFKGFSINLDLYFARKHKQSNTAEYYSNNSIRRESKANAILLILRNLNEKNLISVEILRYFINLSIQFKEYNLFTKIIQLLPLSVAQELKWKLYFYAYPLRISLFKLRQRF